MTSRGHTLCIERPWPALTRRSQWDGQTGSRGRTLEALRSECRRTAADRGGAIVSVTVGRANAIPLTIFIRFRDAQYHVTMQAGEGRSTGTREAMVTGLLFQLGELKIPIVKPPAVSADEILWLQDMSRR